MSEHIRQVVRCSPAAQQVVFVDDAHMMARSVFYDEPVVLGLGDLDVAVWSLDSGLDEVS